MPVAVIRTSNGKRHLVLQEELPDGARTVKPRLECSQSIIQTARDYALMLQAGKARNHSELAQQVGMSRPRLVHLLNLLNLAPAIQDRLVRSQDEGGRIRRTHLYPLVAISDWKGQMVAFNTLRTKVLGRHHIPAKHAGVRA